MAPKPTTPMAKNGKGASATPQTEDARTSTLSRPDHAVMIKWLEGKTHPFSIVTEPLSRKRKRGTQLSRVENNLFDERLSVRFEVRPTVKWEPMRTYKRFTIGTESIGVGECVAVKHDNRGDALMDLQAQWKARVLEVKAVDAEHVFLRVAWLNRPEDLRSGRKAYHGRYELIPTNQMDIIDAMTVNCKIKVEHWDETDEKGQVIEDDVHIWRQTFDCVTTKTLSALQPICVDKVPQNPDHLIVRCSNEECGLWLHPGCIAEKAVKTAASEHADSRKHDKANKKRKVAVTKPTEIASGAQGQASLDGFTAAVFVAAEQDSTNMPDAPVPDAQSSNSNNINSSNNDKNNNDDADRGVAEDEASMSDAVQVAESVMKPDTAGNDAANAQRRVTKSEIVITDADGNKTSQELRCPKCGQAILDS